MDTVETGEVDRRHTHRPAPHVSQLPPVVPGYHDYNLQYEFHLIHDTTLQHTSNKSHKY